MQPLGPGHIEIGFVDRSHLDERREAFQNLEDAPRIFAIALRMPFDEDRVRAKLVSGAQRQRGMNAELTGFVGCRGNHTALVALPADHHRFALERRVEELFHGYEERIHVDVEDGADHCFSEAVFHRPAFHKPARAGFRRGRGTSVHCSSRTRARRRLRIVRRRVRAQACHPASGRARPPGSDARKHRARSGRRRARATAPNRALRAAASRDRPEPHREDSRPPYPQRHRRCI